MTERLIVIGGDAAGMSAASQARRMLPRASLEIIAFERGDHTSYSACGIPFMVGNVVPDPERLIVRTPARFARDDIDARIRHEVEEIDLDARRVLVRDHATGAVARESFDHLMIATGAKPVHPDLPGADARGIFGVQTLADGLAVRRFVDERSPTRAVVVGGGYIGLEMAEALVERGCSVALVEAASHPMTTLDPDMGSLVSDALRSIGVAVHTNERVEAFESNADGVTTVVTDARTIGADIVILGLGVRPNADLAARAGVHIGETTRGIVTDDHMRTSVDGVWAAGDCVESHHRVLRRPAAIALGTHANKQGRVAGTNIGGGDARFPGVVGTAATKVCGVEVARTGANEGQAVEAGFDAISVVIDSRTRAGYFPGAERVKVKVVCERRTGRLLGAQIVGGQGSAKRIDVFATALWNEMTVDEIASMDLAYAPPFAPVWDPVLIAARKAAERIAES